MRCDRIWRNARLATMVPGRDSLGLVENGVVAARDEPANQLVEPMSNLLNRLPTSVLTQLFGTMMRGLDFQASNVPGAPAAKWIVSITGIHKTDARAGLQARRMWHHPPHKFT